MLDYVFAFVLITGPWLLGFARDREETWVPFAVGLGLVINSLVTNYEAGVIRKLPLVAHLTIDVILGLCLILSPWLLDFAALVWLPHVVMGLLLVGNGVLTRQVAGPVPPLERPTGHRTQR